MPFYACSSITFLKRHISYFFNLLGGCKCNTIPYRNLLLLESVVVDCFSQIISSFRIVIDWIKLSFSNMLAYWTQYGFWECPFSSLFAIRVRANKTALKSRPSQLYVEVDIKPTLAHIYVKPEFKP